MAVVKDLTGQRFGRLLVLRHVGSNAQGRALFACGCSCGAQTIVVGKALRQGKTKSCGCLKAEGNPELFRGWGFDLIGRQFGRWTVTARATEGSGRGPWWNVRCTCGSEKTVQGGELLRGNTRSCGCLQRELAAQAHRVTTPSYSAAHTRLRKVKGEASTHTCVDCGEPAREWSWVGSCDDALVQGGAAPNAGLRYCLHPDCYVSRCKKCHIRYDTALLSV